MVFLDWMSEQDKVGVGVLTKRTVNRSVSSVSRPQLLSPSPSPASPAL